MATINAFGAEAKLSTQSGDLSYYRLNKLVEQGIGDVHHLPVSIKVLLESCLRNLDNFQINEQDVRGLAAWNAAKPNAVELPFKVARVILQDFTGVPAVVDFAAIRSSTQRAGCGPRR